MKRIATSIVEVRGGRVVNYHGDYDSYLYYVNKEIEDGERELAAKSAPGKARLKVNSAEDRKARAQQQRDLRKELTTVERTIAKLDVRKRELNAEMLQTSDAARAMKLHEEITAIAKELAPAEERWCKLQEQIETDEE